MGTPLCFPGSLRIPIGITIFYFIFLYYFNCSGLIFNKTIVKIMVYRVLDNDDV